ncbi:MAG: ectonucleotide pyrophosphatase/phosphodiesterase [Clostridia bacterium]|nr:ectonucleotide pyrophosphatase/phosphodiesterase [Clostridia bacterium]
MRKTIIISMDALFDADITQLGSDSFIGKLMLQGSWCNQLKTIYPALTYPTHVTLMTGAKPCHHGIGHNMKLQPQYKVKDRDWYWDIAEVKHPTMFHAVHRAGGKCCSLLWPVTGKAKCIRWNFPEVMAVRGENQLMKMMSYGSKSFMLMNELKHGRIRNGIKEPNLSDYSAAVCCDTIKHHAPDLTAVHFVDLDEMRHKHGTYSKQAMEALKRMDRRVEQIYRTACETPAMGDFLMVLVSDHGQADVRETFHMQRWLEKIGLGDDFTAQANAMSCNFYLRHEKADVSALMMHAGRDKRISHVYTKEELESLGYISGVPVAVEAAEGICMVDCDAAKPVVGTHGYGPGHPAENSFFCVAGNGIRQNMQLPPMHMWDVAPTVLALMGVPFECKDGHSFSDIIQE